MKKVLPVILAACASALVVFLMTRFFPQTTITNTTAEVLNEESILPQEVLGLSEETHPITKIYDAGRLLGVLTNQASLDSMLEEVYKSNYEATYPGSRLDIGKDIYQVTENSYYEYENIDTAICDYLQEKNTFTVQTNAIEFSDASGTYATIYVLNLDDYTNALTQYLSYFVEPDALYSLMNNHSIAELTTYGSRDTGISIAQTITQSKAFASPEEIMTTEEAILYYLEYGNNTELEYYTVQDGDSVEGVGSLNYGLSANQIMVINSDVISSVDQVLSPGTQLCVTYFTSPIDVVVNKESMRKEIVYPTDTLYVTDDTLQEGLSEVQQEPSNGSQNTLYNEVWVNGVLIQGSQVSSVVTTQPQQEIIRVGSLEIPGVGTGTFRWPVENPFVTCRIYCYPGHTGTDIQNRYDRYGDVLAADRGTIEVNAYHPINGNYYLIDHGNGYETYYGHMNVPGYYEEGVKVDKGQVIGQIGMTGLATGPHVHFEVHLDGVNIDACNFLDCNQ